MTPTANRASAVQGSAAPAPSPRGGQGWEEGATSPFAPTAFAPRAKRKSRIARDIALFALAALTVATVTQLLTSAPTSAQAGR